MLQKKKIKIKKTIDLTTCDYLVLDMSNLLYRTFFTHKNESDDTIAGLAMHAALMTINKCFKDFQPSKKIVMAFDRSNWRKAYTNSDQCVSKKPYKGNRRQNMTPSEQKRYEIFLSHIADFETMVKEHSSSIILAGDMLEADDLISGFIQQMSSDNKIIIVSADKDLIQLLGFPNVRLINPLTNEERNLDEWDGNSELFLHEKCIRGDTGDNVQSAFPRCRKTMIVKSFNDDFELVNLLNQTWTHIDGTVFSVKELYIENRRLMDLRAQPDNIKQLINETISNSMNNIGSCSYFHFMKFLGKYQLKKIAEDADRFIRVLNH